MSAHFVHFSRFVLLVAAESFMSSDVTIGAAVDIIACPTGSIYERLVLVLELKRKKNIIHWY